MPEGCVPLAGEYIVLGNVWIFNIVIDVE
jgi:hypothetical protein